MIAEKMQRTIDNMRAAHARNNGDFAELAPFFLDNLECDVERVAGLEGAAVLNFDDVPYTGRRKTQTGAEVVNG